MIIFALGLLGLCLGSFVNALVWRIREQSLVTSRQSKSRKIKTSDKKLATSDFQNLSILKGRSMCPHCHHMLSALDLLPLLSWIGLRGKCRYCHKNISWQYPLMELITAAVFVLSYIWWPVAFNASGTFNYIIWLLILTGFMALLVYDLRWMLLPDRIVYPLIALSVVAAVVNIVAFKGGLHMASDIAISLIIASGLFYGLFQLSKGKWIGGGDVKLGVIIGLVVAVPLQAFLVLFLASLIGTVTILPGLASKKLKATSRIPFGPYLIVATIIIKVFGASLVAWYRKKFLLY